MLRIRKEGLLHSVIVLLAFAFSPSGFAADPDLRLGEERAADNETEVAAKMVEAIKAVSQTRHPKGLMKRFNQVKSVGCVSATFSVPAELSTELQQGVFVAGKTYSAKVRFANASKTDDQEKDFRGMSIKLFGVEGHTLMGVEGEQHFLLNSYPALFAADPDDFLEFIEAARDDRLWKYFIRPSHFYSLLVLFRGREEIDNPLAIPYWSTTPYRFGQNASSAVKYSARPCQTPSTAVPAQQKHENFLTDAMQAQLKNAPACFNFMVQFQKDPVEMPIEDASVTWDEQQSPFIKVATLTIKDQAFAGPSEVAACEAMSFNPWQALAAHQPLGGINRVRKNVYSEIAQFRYNENARREPVSR